MAGAVNLICKLMLEAAVVAIIAAYFFHAWTDQWETIFWKEMICYG